METFKTYVLFIFITLLLDTPSAHSQHINRETVSTEQNFKIKLDTISGLIKSYYMSGSIKEVKTLRNGQLEGSWRFYYENGKVKTKGNFKNNKPEGCWKRYDKKGYLIRVKNYKEGLEDGICKEYYSNGLLKIKGQFAKGKREHVWSTYSYTGKELYSVVYSNDTLIKTLDLEVNTCIQSSEIAGNL